MSMKKKLGSKLSEGVRQVKSQREPVPAGTPAKTGSVTKPAQTMPANPGHKPPNLATKPEAPRVATQADTNSNKLHPQRVWPD